MKQNKKKLGKEAVLLLFTALLLVVGIVLIVTLVIIPGTDRVAKIGKYQGDEFNFNLIDFSDSEWIKDLTEQKIALYEVDFIQDLAFTYSEDGGYLSVTYTSGKAVEVTRKHYLELLENGVASEENSESLLDISGEISGTGILIKNYFSEVTNLYQLTITLNEETVSYIKDNTQDLFPAEMISNTPEFASFVNGEVYGGYVLYSMNEYSETSYCKVPIVSRAYVTSDDAERYMRKIEDTQSLFDEFRLVEEKNAAYGKKDGYLIRLGFVINKQGQALSTISAQRIPTDTETE